MICPSKDEAAKIIGAISGIDRATLIEQDKENPMRINVWDTTQKHLRDLFSSLSVSSIEGVSKSVTITGKVARGLKRIENSSTMPPNFLNDIINDVESTSGSTKPDNIANAIALYEIIEAAKGEADVATNNKIEISKISDEGAVLPNLVAARVAAVIGRKIMFQKGYRFKTTEDDKKTPADNEALYQKVGTDALEHLESKGYVKFLTGAPSIKTYREEKDGKGFTKVKVVNNTKVVTLVAKKFGMRIIEGKPNNEANYILNRSLSQTHNTALGSMLDVLSVARQVTQPSDVTLPDTKARRSDEEHRKADGQNIVLGDKTHKVRKKLYEKPLKVNKAVHGFMSTLHDEVMRTGMTASEVLKKQFVGNAAGYEALFGVKNHHRFSIDKKESVIGQDLSRTVAINDLAEYYDLLMDNGSPAELHMALKVGRNERLYYLNSVLNPHASKQSRAMLTPGEQVIDVDKGDGLDYLINQVAESFKGDLTHNDITGNGKLPHTKLKKALKLAGNLEDASSFHKKFVALTHLQKLFPNSDYVAILTGLQAIKDIRNPVNGKVTTEFPVSTDATAQGGTLTFMLAAGNADGKVKGFLQKLGIILKDDGTASAEASDIYELMTEAVDEYIREDGTTSAALEGIDTDKLVGTFRDTLNLLFDEGREAREYSKPSTMTFIYEQGREGAIETIVSDLADRIMDTLGTKETTEYLNNLFGDSRFTGRSKDSINEELGVYPAIKKQLVASGMPGKMVQLLDASINEEFLSGYKTRADKIFNLVERKMDGKILKMMPADTILEGKTADKHLAKYGMPIAKIFEVMSKVGDVDVITRKEILHKTIMSVSATHGIDSALLYHTIADANLNDGVVVVHDQVMGTVEDVRAFESLYTGNVKKIMETYDVHEQMLEALAVYIPSIVTDPEYKVLLKDVQTTKVEKQKIAEGFNMETVALMGNGDAHVEFAEGKSERKSNVSKEASVENTTTMSKLNDLSSKSELIKTFLKSFGTTAASGSEFSFDAKTDTLTIDSKVTNESEVIEAVEHEIVHAATATTIHEAMAGRGDEATANDVRYFDKTIDKLLSMVDAKPTRFSQELLDRLGYIAAQPSREHGITEFVAIMQAEKEVAREVYELLDKRGTLGSRIENFIRRVVESIRELTQQDFSKDVDPALLYGALQRTLASGISDRRTRQKEIESILKDIDTKFLFKNSASGSSVAYLNRAAVRLVTSRAEKAGKGILRNVHEKSMDYDIYEGVINKIIGVYDDSDAFQGLMHTITGEGVDKAKKAFTIAQYAKTRLQREDFISASLKDFQKLTAPMPTEAKTTLDDSITKVPMYLYFVESSAFDTKDKIDAEVSRIEAKLGVNSVAVKDVNSLVALNTRDEVEGSVYNLTSYESRDSDYAPDVRRLLTLKSIQAVGTEGFVSMLENKELMTLLEDHVAANHLSLIGISGKEHLRATDIPHSYAEGVQQRVITLEQLDQYQYGEDTGWKVALEPTKEKLGVVYREVIDSTMLEGAFTDVKMSYSDINVDNSMSGYKNVIKTPLGHKLVIKEATRKTMGVRSAVQSLVRSTAHSMSIQESEIIRQTLLEKETTFKVNAGNMKDLEDVLADDTRDNYWFLKADGIQYKDLPDKVKARYMPVGKRVSNVNGFNEQVTWVRKDISHWLMGGQKDSPFENPKWKWGLRITKNLVSMSKINMVILNPGKIARDNISNITYLSVMGVGPNFAYENYTEIMSQFHEYNESKEELLSLKVRLVANPDSTKLKAKAKAIRKKISRNPISDIEDKGFLNSLGSSLVLNSSEDGSGLQKDIDTALTYLLKQKDGKNNYLSHLLMKVQAAGFQGEGLLTHLGNIVGRADAGKGFEKELDGVRERLSTIRDEKDMVAYASQFINSPQAEAVRVGANITDLSDVLAKETYYRHLVETGMKPEEARIKVLDSFPNYAENMPMAIQQLSDVGILMFPSFWLRIQKVIYRMAKEKPLSLATEEILDSYLGTNIDSIVGSNIINKATSWGGFLHSPYENVGASSILPTHAF